MNHNIGLIFIHGAGLNSSIWDELKMTINVPMLAVDFPHRKGGAANEKLKFEDYITAVTAQIKNWNRDRFIIVAHSIGACVGIKVADHFKKELQGFVAIGAVIPASGNSFVSSLPFPQKLIMPFILRLFGTRPPNTSIERELCNDLTTEQTNKITTGFTPEATSLYTTKINYTLPKTKRLFIKLTSDKTMPVALQDAMAKNLKAEKTIAFDSGHLPMLSRPKEIAQILSGFINEIDFNRKLDLK